MCKYKITLRHRHIVTLLPSQQLSGYKEFSSKMKFTSSRQEYIIILNFSRISTLTKHLDFDMPKICIYLVYWHMSKCKVVYRTKKLPCLKTYSNVVFLQLQCSYQNKFVYASPQISICQLDKFTSTYEKFLFSISAKQNKL